MSFQDVLRTAELVEECIKVHGLQRTESILCYHGARAEIMYTEGEKLVRWLAVMLKDKSDLSQLQKDLQATAVDIHRWNLEHFPIVRAISVLSTKTVPEDSKRLITDLINVPIDTTWAKVLEAVPRLSPEALKLFKNVLFAIEDNIY